MRFLETMGQSIGDFDVHDLNLNVQDMLFTYRVVPWMVRDKYLRIAGDRGPAGVSYFMDRSRPYGKDDCMIVTMLDPRVNRDQCDRLHAGLEEFLYVEAYRTVRLPLFDHQVELAIPALSMALTGKFDQVCDTAEKLGFVWLPPARRCALYERGDAAMVLYRDPVTEDFSFRLASSDLDELSRMIAIFRDATGVQSVQG